jgi:predicted aspartyl protease
MKARYGLCAAVAALTVLAQPAPAQDCRLTLITSLPITWSEDRSVLVPATIDGNDRLLLIDTAGIYNLITASAADDMHLTRRALNQKMHLTLGVSGTLLSEGAIARTFKLGNITADRMQFAVIPGTKLRKMAAGTLGPSVMANYDVEIDPVHNAFNLFSHDHCPGQVVYWTHTPYAVVPMRLDSFLHIIIPVSLDGHVFEATIDTGSSTSWLQYDLARGPFGWDDSTKDLTPLTESGDTNWFHYPFKTLSLNGVEVQNPQIAVHKEPGALDGPTALVIGMDVLSKLHTFISYADLKMYFTAANAPPPDQAPATSQK